VSDAEKVCALRALARHLAHPLRPLLLTPALPPPRARPAFARAAMPRMMTGYTTAIMPIAATAERQAARLRASRRRTLAVFDEDRTRIACIDARSDLPALDACLERHEEERRRRGYAMVGREVTAAAARRGPTLLATARGADGLVAFVLVFVHGATATWQVGWTSPAGRTVCAHHRLLWAVSVALGRRGVRLLDLGGLNVPAGIVHFKLASGAVPRTFVGTYLARAGLTARARCPNRGSPASSREGSSAERRGPPSAARTSSACRVARAA
jgi:hypothetical protein